MIGKRPDEAIIADIEGLNKAIESHQAPSVDIYMRTYFETYLLFTQGGDFMAKPQYFVVQNADKEAFEKAVETNLSRGWKLVGGVFMHRMKLYDGGPEQVCYCQALTKGGQGA